ncbi:hypothetical protein HG536_0H04920 [Torulaspora globosa]|uniref:N-acetyltransferase domain-containing protein n=1 Tax=Torulaspora globosa TaxID=48254 RepID=A0A7G3ZNN0_9SACH|nr:uncharacterized protein HG536_0H04920 [Torulaspora globosa]QLL35116.1 hypothetical protein HG536_0H04920 [Torulaspora globosa]
MTTCTVNKTNDIAKLQKTLAIAFADSAACHYLSKKFLEIPTSKHLSDEELYDTYRYFCEDFLARGGLLLESNNFDCAAIVLPPQDKPVKTAKTKDPRFNEQFIETIARHKEALQLGSKIKYYYLFMIGKNLEQPEVRGSARAILTYLKQKADEQNAAVVLEAISDKAKKVYEYFGFIDYADVNYGQGDVDSNGRPDPDGEGFVLNLMVYYKGGKLLPK